MQFLRILFLVLFFLPTVGCHKDADDVPELIMDLQNVDAKVRKVAALEIARIGPPAQEAVTALGKALYDPDTDVRDSAIYALNNIGTEDAKKEMARVLPRLVSDLQDSNPETRWAAATALGYLGKNGRDAVPALVRAVGDEHAAVGNAAAYSLRKIGDPDAMRLLKGDESALKEIFSRPESKMMGGRNEVRPQVPPK